MSPWFLSFNLFPAWSSPTCPWYALRSAFYSFLKSRIANVFFFSLNVSPHHLLSSGLRCARLNAPSNPHERSPPLTAALPTLVPRTLFSLHQTPPAWTWKRKWTLLSRRRKWLCAAAEHLCCSRAASSRHTTGRPACPGRCLDALDSCPLFLIGQAAPAATRPWLGLAFSCPCLLGWLALGCYQPPGLNA